MKRFNRASRLACVAASVLVGSAALMAGCAKEGYSYDRESGMTYITSRENSYIVVHENDIDTLHMGDIVVKSYDVSTISYPLTPILKFKCGESLETFMYVPYDKCPSREKYDRVCFCAKDYVPEEDLEPEA